MAENNNTTIYTTKNAIDFGNKFNGKLISTLFDSPGGRNYLIWMKQNNFKMSAQLFKKVETQEKENKAKNGHIYEYDPNSINSANRTSNFDDRDAASSSQSDQAFERGY